MLFTIFRTVWFFSAFQSAVDVLDVTVSGNIVKTRKVQKLV
jgi:hypothetical protein